MANPDGIAPVAEVKGGPVDFAVVTALKLEREAVLKVLTKDTNRYKRTTSRSLTTMGTSLFPLPASVIQLSS